MSLRRTPSATLLVLAVMFVAPCAPARLSGQVRDSVRRDSVVGRDTAARRVGAAVDTVRASPADSAMQRARQMVIDGNGAVGRALADSVVARVGGTPALADALYWRGSIAATAADAERDYRRVVVEYPFSAHAGDALLALAQLEMARGDRPAATEHLRRFLLEHADAPQRTRAGFWLGRMLVEDNQLPQGCAVLLRTRAAVPDSEAELRNQIDYYSNRCAGVDTASAPAMSRSNPSAVTRRDSTTPASGGAPTRSAAPTRSSAPPRAAVPKGAAMSKRYTVQVAAYTSRAAAEQLVARLARRGLAARVVTGGAAPYRVRMGSYATEREAEVAARELKAKGIAGFVTTETTPDTREPR